MKQLVLIVLLILAVVMAWWWLRPVDPPYQDLIAQIADAPVAVLEADPEGVSPDEAGLEDRESAAAATVEKGETVSEDHLAPVFDPQDIRQLSPENVIEFTRRNLERALKGDEAAAHRVGRTKTACWAWGRGGIAAAFYMRRNSPQARAAHLAMDEISGVEQGYQLLVTQSDFLPSSPIQHLGSPEQVQASLQRWQAGCAGHDRLFDSTLRQRLDDLASQGHVVARYLYATLRLSEHELAESDHFTTQWQWERKARRYSRENLEQGEVLGLLAYAHSYRTSTFTTWNSGLSLALYKAALDCGYSAPDLKAWAKSVFVPNEESGEYSLFMLLVLDEAEKLKQACQG